MAVEIERYSDLAVPEPFAGDLGVNAVGEQMGGMGMSQIVKPQVGKPRLADRARPMLRDVDRLHYGAVGVRDD